MLRCTAILKINLPLWDMLVHLLLLLMTWHHGALLQDQGSYLRGPPALRTLRVLAHHPVFLLNGLVIWNRTHKSTWHLALSLKPRPSHPASYTSINTPFLVKLWKHKVDTETEVTACVYLTTEQKRGRESYHELKKHSHTIRSHVTKWKDPCLKRFQDEKVNMGKRVGCFVGRRSERNEKQRQGDNGANVEQLLRKRTHSGYACCTPLHDTNLCCQINS